MSTGNVRPEPVVLFSMLRDLPVDRRDALLDQLRDFQPGASWLLSEEAETIAAAAGVPENYVETALRTIRYLSAGAAFDPSLRAAKEVDGASVIDVLARVVALDDRDEEGRGLIKSLVGVATELIPRFVRLEAAESTLPSFRGVSVSLDLRYIPESDPIAMAIIRLAVDDGPSMMFQVTEKSLQILIHKLTQASEQMTRFQQTFVPSATHEEKLDHGNSE